MNNQECQTILKAAAEDMLTAVVSVAREYGPDNPFNLYVYANGEAFVDAPAFLQNHNTLAQAPVMEYTSVESLVSALGETLPDDVEDDDDKADQDARVAALESDLSALREGEFPCNYCVFANINGISTHEQGCQVPRMIGRLMRQLEDC